MRSFLVLGFLLGGMAAAAAAPAGVDSLFTPRERAQGYRDHVIFAKPRATHRGTVDASEAREHVRVRQKFARFGNLRVIELDDFDAADRAIARLRATGRYEFVERDHFLQLAATPNDTVFSVQWSLNNVGQSGGLPGADMRAVAAWDIIHDAPTVIVAILDSGLNVNHLDISANLWRNPAPTFGDVNGASFVNGVRSGDVSDNNGHGTHVAGIIGAVGNNGYGIAGIAWKVQIMPVRIMVSSGLIADSDFAAGIEYAISHGAQIMNASLYTDTRSEVDIEIIRAARAAGVILVVAAGNDALDLGTKAYYPGSYPFDNIVTVGSSNRHEAISSYSNYGAMVDLFAPGEDILSLYSGNNTDGVSLSGTSMASPAVAGALVLLRARFPGDTHRQLINRLLRGTDALPVYATKAQTGGRLNLFKALTTTDPRPFNDDFAARSRLAGAALQVRSNNEGATAEPGEPAPAGLPAGATLWWEWTSPVNGAVTLDTFGSGYDTVLAVYTGSTVGALAPVAANDDDGLNTTSRLTFQAQSGATYEIALGGKNGATGTALLHLGLAPANDSFAGATALDGVSLRVDGVNRFASREAGEPGILGFAGGASVWYRWTAPRSGRFQIATTSTEFDTLLAVYTGSSLAGLALVAASDNTALDHSNTDSLCTIDAVAGVTYFLTVDAKLAGTAGAFTLTLTDSLWQASTLRHITGAPAVAPDGTVYVGSTDFNFYAFAPDGAVKWIYPAGDTFEFATPAVGPDGTVYFYSLDGRVYAVRSDGSTRWVHDFGVASSIYALTVAGSPALGADGTLYVKAGNGYLYALNPADGSAKWSFNVHAVKSYASPVVAPDGTIYQGSEDNNLYALNANGTLKWKFGVDNAILCGPALDLAGNVYFTVRASGKLWSLTPAGALRWTYAGASLGSSSSPALSADGATVYFGAQDKRLYAVGTSDGAARWSVLLGDEVQDSSPAIDANGVIYLGAMDGRLYAVNPDGTLKRTYDLGAAIHSSPAIFGTTLYLGSDDAKLYAFDLGAYAGAGPWPQYRQNARRLGRASAEVPAITGVPLAQDTAVGQPLSVNVVAVGQGPLSYQWLKDGQPIPGATSAVYALAGATAGDAGNYSVTVTGPQGATTSAAVAIAVGPGASPSGHLSNLSVLTEIVSPGDSFTLGTVIGGGDTLGGKPLLVRAVGPALTPLGVGGALADPRFDFFGGSSRIGGDDDWGGDAALSAAMAQVGAFPFGSSASKDAALVVTVPPGSYSQVVRGAGTGTVLAELYDSTSAETLTPQTPRLLNVSVLKPVRAGTLLTVGFTLAGSTGKNVLIRAIGPGLGAAPFHIAGVMAEPRLTLFGSHAVALRSNGGWSGDPQLVAAIAATGAFPIADAASKDAMLLVTLVPGSYTVQVGGAGGAGGIVIVEVYEAP